MTTPSLSSIESLQARLTAAGLSLSGTRAHHAMDQLRSSVSEDACLEEAIRHEKSARESWIENALQPWCKRHGLTLEQGISVFFEDHAYDPLNPEKSLVTRENLFWSGQETDFIAHIKANQAPSTDELLLACINSGDEIMKEHLARKTTHSKESAPLSNKKDVSSQEQISLTGSLHLAYEAIESMLAMRRPDLLETNTARAACRRVGQNGGTGAYLQSALARIEDAQAQILREIMRPKITKAPGESSEGLSAVEASQPSANGVTLLATLQRWDVEQGCTEPLPYEPTYLVQLAQQGQQGQQICLSMKPKTHPSSLEVASNGPSLQLTLEVIQGLPCVHVHTDTVDALQATIFGTADGSIVIRKGDTGPIEHKIATPDFSPDPREIAEQLEWPVDPTHETPSGG